MIFTHGHPDHIGSAAPIVRETGATTWMHAADTPLAETGGPFHPMSRVPGLMHAVVFRMVWNPKDRMQPFGIDKNMADGAARASTQRLCSFRNGFLDDLARQGLRLSPALLID